MSANTQLQKYTEVSLTTDVAKLSENDKKMIPLLIDAAKAMDEVFWKEAYGNKDSLLNSISDENLGKFAEINYGPWDRLKNNESFISGIGTKPKGANFYPADMTKEELNESKAENLKDLYTVVRRHEDGSLYAIPYHEIFSKEHQLAAAKVERSRSICR